MARSTMAALIARVKAMANGDTTLTDDDYQTLLDDHSVQVDSRLIPRRPFYTVHTAPFENLESGAVVYYGYNTRLTETTDYTIDLQRGIVTTLAADYRGLCIQATAYDINAAAADAWERIAARSADAFDWSDVEGSYKPSQARDYALAQAKTYRRRAWAVSTVIERGDTVPTDGQQQWNSEAIRRAKAGY